MDNNSAYQLRLSLGHIVGGVALVALYFLPPSWRSSAATTIGGRYSSSISSLGGG